MNAIDEIWENLCARAGELGATTGAAGSDATSSAATDNVAAIEALVEQLGLDFEIVDGFARNIYEQALRDAQAARVLDVGALVQGTAVFAFLTGYQYARRDPRA